MKRRILEIMTHAKDRAEVANHALWTGEVRNAAFAAEYLEAANRTYCRAKRILERRYGYYPNG